MQTSPPALNLPASLTDAVAEFIATRALSQWRPMRVVVCQHRTIPSFGDFLPLYTDGIIVVVKLCRNDFHCPIHLDQVVWPKEIPHNAPRAKSLGTLPRNNGKPCKTARPIFVNDL